MKSRSIRPWKEEVKDLFVMHKGERRGFTVLLVLGLLAAAWVTYEQWLRSGELKDREKLEVAWRSMQEPSGERMAGGDRPLTLFAFDPNGLPTEDWVKLGLTERQAEAIHRYEEHGGRFRTKADLAKMRVVDAALFEQWKDYIQLPDTLLKRDRGAFAERSDRQWDEEREGKDRSDRRTSAPTRGSVEINTADSMQLVALPGIGPSFAKGILKYRERLGGFHDLDQLNEVYVLRDRPDAVDRLRSLLTVDTSSVKRYDVNTCTAEELGPHPYAGWKVARALIAFRKQHGAFRRLADIKGCVLVTDSIFQHLAPYLIVEGTVDP